MLLLLKSVVTASSQRNHPLSKRCCSVAKRKMPLSHAPLLTSLATLTDPLTTHR